ncbi:hydrophobic protein [Kitasatospora sp. GP82]|uniref:hydrophobic protein n=1 Tax=Kitasatospora sp. GP82 TaxID=3035089 RepID=UPI002472FE6C|nr:hydrophobic protein [Kitasatospora sp. GP82]MDH6129032.1 hypothetical protein [Kitasatospora sp. GP82]
MIALLLVLLVIIALAGAGFALHVLWWVAVLVLWLLGFVARGASVGGVLHTWGFAIYLASRDG